MRISRPLAFALVAVVIGGVGGYLGWAGWRSSEGDAERALSSEGSSYSRRDHARCVRVDDSLPWEFACTFQEVGLQGASDRPLQVVGMQVRAGHIGTGTSRLPVRCAVRVRCWVRKLCDARSGCPPLKGLSFPVLAGSSAAPRPLTSKSCVDAWNVHGGFTPDQAAIERQVVPSPVSTGRRPIYTPHLAAAALGFIASRSEVRATGGRCSVRFDLGARGIYRIDSHRRAVPRFWTWAGRRRLDPRPPGQFPSNACQRADGTLSLGGDCLPVPAGAGRDIPDELDRGVLKRVADMGGYPYWLGSSFHGARPEPRPSGPDSQAIAYTLRDGARPETLLVVTSVSSTSPPPVEGVLVLQFRPIDNPVLVVADRSVTAELTAEVRAALRPFLRDKPNAPQVPGDLGEEPTRIDTSVPVQVYWAGAVYKGRRATVIGDAPPGVGLVRYGEPGSPDLFYVATYRPLKKTRCGRVGCVSPPPLPAVLRRYGERKDAMPRTDGWIIDNLAAPGSASVNGYLLFQALRPAR